MRISEMQAKEIVNLNNGKRLGYMNDLRLNLGTGRIEAIIVSPTRKVSNIFMREPEIVVMWDHIVKIGSDVILVRVNDFNSLPYSSNYEKT